MGDFFMNKFGLKDHQKKYFYVGGIILSVYLFLKYISPVVSPFLLAFLIAGGLCRLTRKVAGPRKKSLLAGFLLVLFVSLFAILLWAVTGLLIEKGGDLAIKMPYFEEDLCRLLTDCCDRMESRFGMDGGEMEEFVLRQINVFAENLEVKVFPAVMNKSVTYMKSIGGLISFVAVTLIAVFLMLKDYERVSARIRQNRDFKGVIEVAGKVLHYVKTYVKAQIVILLVISGVCMLVLSFAGPEGSLFLGFLAGVMDVFPFIGTGLVLVPVSLFQLIGGNYWQAVVVLVLYAGCVLIREFLEPKLIGNKVGIWPVGILFAVFAGVQLFGVAGIIKGPLGLVVICETCRYLFGNDY
ncbi:MAG: AI-2E family transporter [Lachnospiraceae bacterium]|nr:AI-2E family transporter [Lachnospiraceae bacterium]